MTEHTYIYAWNWLYVMDYYKCMLRECGDRIINMYIQDSVKKEYMYVCKCMYVNMYMCMYVCMYVCLYVYIELKKGESW